MEKKNFYGEVKHLHKVVVAEIYALMVEYNKDVIDLAGSPAPHAFIVGTPDFDADVDYMEAEVLKVILEDGVVKFDINWNIDSEEYLEQHPNKYGDIGDLYVVVEANDFERLVPCAGISSVYEAVWEYLTNGYTGYDRDKKVFLLDNEVYTAYEANDFTEDDLESLVSEETYTENFTIIKIDANDYDSFEEAIEGEGLSKDGYYIRVFGF